MSGGGVSGMPTRDPIQEWAAKANESITPKRRSQGAGNAVWMRLSWNWLRGMITGDFTKFGNEVARKLDNGKLDYAALRWLGKKTYKAAIEALPNVIKEEQTTTSGTTSTASMKTKEEREKEVLEKLQLAATLTQNQDKKQAMIKTVSSVFGDVLTKSATIGDGHLYPSSPSAVPSAPSLLSTTLSTTRVAASAPMGGPGGPIDYRADEAGKLKFLLCNTTPSGMPKSFAVPDGYWARPDVGSQADVEANRNERILATYGLNIYDGATAQKAYAMMGSTEAATQHTKRLYSGTSGNMALRASSDFTYGEQSQKFSGDQAFFFRMTSDQYVNNDPLTGQPVNWMDWKPVAGEQAWAAFIGPLQAAHVKYKGQIPVNCKEVELGLNLLPALKAMQSKIGAIYYLPGTNGQPSPQISCENNASLYAGLRMLRETLVNSNDETQKGAIAQIDSLMQGIESFFKNYAYDKEEGVFYQGGSYDPKSATFMPNKVEFAVDVQTWGITVLGPKKIDEWFGPGTALAVWQNTRKRGGYYEQDILKGVGYSDNGDKNNNHVLSVEWTFGAILLAKELRSYYQDQPDTVKNLGQDIDTMRAGMEALKQTLVIDGEETVVFPYANKRYYIPFGWWANNIPSLTSTAWALMNDRDFNPFVLGGGSPQPELN